jgi:hypothetical protein
MFARGLITLTIGLVIGLPPTAALAQTASEVKQISVADQANAVAASLRATIAALPAETSADVFEGQIAAVIEQSGAPGSVTAAAVQQLLASPDLPANAQTALRAVSRIAIAQYRKKPFAVGGVGGGLGGMPLSSSPSALAGGAGSSDYNF